MPMTDRTPALEWERDDFRQQWTARAGPFRLFAHDLSESGKSLWRVLVYNDMTFRWLDLYLGQEESVTAAQLAAEDFLRAQRDALGVLDRKEG